MSQTDAASRRLFPSMLLEILLKNPDEEENN